MSDINSRKRKLSLEKKTLNEFKENASKKSCNHNGTVINEEASPDLNMTPVAMKKPDDSQFIYKSAIKTISRIVTRNIFDTIGRNTSLLTRRTLRSRRSSLHSHNQRNNWSTITALEADSQSLAVDKRKQSLRNYSTLKLRNIKEKFKTKPRLRKTRFQSLQAASHERFFKDLNQSRVGNDKQEKLLSKLLEKHNKHLESL